MTTRSAYDDCLELLLRTCRQLGPDVVASVVLYGSMARGAVRPGESDVLDALVILQDAVLQDPGVYASVTGALVGVCREIALSGLRFHPFRYLTVSELARVPAFELPCWRSDRFSRTVLGEDLRGRIASVDADLVFLRGAFFAGRRTIQATGSYLAADVSPGAQAAACTRAVMLLTKILPARACAACGDHADASEALERCARVLPGFDPRPYETLQRAAREAGPLDDTAILDGVVLMLDLNERLHDLVMDWLRRNGMEHWLRGRLVEEGASAR